MSETAARQTPWWLSVMPAPAYDPDAIPICDVCNKPVESISRKERLRDRAMIFTVRCHGAMETVTLTLAQLQEGPITLHAGRAFVSTVRELGHG
jgi:hypothetical protein